MQRARASLIAAVLMVPFWCASSCLAAGAQAATAKSADVTINGNQPWIDTGMDVNAGDKLHITAKGTVDFKDKPGVGPEGAQRGWADTLRALSVSSAGRGALVGQIGNDRAATPFLVGADGTITATTTGRLYLGVNQDQFSKPDWRPVRGTHRSHGGQPARCQFDQLRLQAAVRDSWPEAALPCDRSGGSGR